MLRLRKKMTDNVNGVEDKFNQLALIGVETDEKSGRLTINESKFRAALDENPLEIKKLFTQKKDNTEPIVLGLGNSRRTVYDPKDPLPGEIDEIKVVVGDKEFSTDSNSTPLIKKSELYKYQVSKVDLLKYIINKDVKTKDEALAKLGKKLPPNAVVIDDVTGKFEFGTPPKKGVKVFVENKKITARRKTGTDEGIATRMEGFLKPYTTFGGTMDNHIKAYDTNVKDINEWIDRTNDRLDKREDSLKKSFGSMEGALQTNKSVSGWLSGQTAGL
jgi:flagellar capping protein FliD